MRSSAVLALHLVILSQPIMCGKKRKHKPEPRSIVISNETGKNIVLRTDKGGFYGSLNKRDITTFRLFMPSLQLIIQAPFDDIRPLIVPLSPNITSITITRTYPLSWKFCLVCIGKASLKAAIKEREH